MKLFGNFKDALRLLFGDKGFLWLDESMLDMKVKRIDRMAPFLDSKGDRSERFVDPSCVERLCGCAKDAIDGVKTLDMVIDEIKYLRGRLAERVMEMRNAYRPPSHRKEISKLKEMDGDTPENEVRPVVASILGYKDILPDEFVNVRALELNSRNFSGFEFGVSGKPTAVKVVIPTEVDYATEYGIPENPEEFAVFPVDRLEAREIPEIKMIVYIGASSDSGDYGVHANDTVCTSCSNLEVLADKIGDVLSLDVREKLKEIRDIADVNDVEDFAYWRALRCADASARLNTKEE